MRRPSPVPPSPQPLVQLTPEDLTWTLRGSSPWLSGAAPVLWLRTEDYDDLVSPVCLPIPLNEEDQGSKPTRGWMAGTLTSCTPSDSTKLKASECFPVSLEWTYWTLPEVRSAWVKELIWMPNERRREKQEYQDMSHPFRQGDARFFCRITCIVHTAFMPCPWIPCVVCRLFSYNNICSLAVYANLITQVFVFHSNGRCLISAPFLSWMQLKSLKGFGVIAVPTLFPHPFTILSETLP